MKDMGIKNVKNLFRKIWLNFKIKKNFSKNLLIKNLFGVFFFQKRHH